MAAIAEMFDTSCEHGEGPLWDPVAQQFYWVDLLAGDYYKADYASGKVEKHSVGQALGVLALREKGGLVMGLHHGFGFFDEASGNLEMVVGGPEADNPETRFNDGAVDPAGRFFAGTMTFDGGKDIGKLYRLDPNGSITVLREKMLLPNGIGWSPDRSKFYLTDSFENMIYLYDYDLSSGDISNPRDFITFAKNEYPDGITVDSEGTIWVAMWEGGKISRFDDQGKKIEDIPVPVTYPTSCCFGGPDLKRLFITTSKLHLDEAGRQEQPLAGRILTIETDTVGQIEPQFKG